MFKEVARIYNFDLLDEDAFADRNYKEALINRRLYKVKESMHTYRQITSRGVLTIVNAN